MALRGGWRLRASVLVESFAYPEYLYGDYALEVDGDTVAFPRGERIPNFDVVLTANTPSWERFSANLFFIAGRDENFFEWRTAGSTTCGPMPGPPSARRTCLA